MPLKNNELFLTYVEYDMFDTWSTYNWSGVGIVCFVASDIK